MSTLTGTGTMVRFILRRDRVRLPVWIVSVVAFVLLTSVNLPGLYPDAAARQARAALMDSPTAQAVTGPGHGLEDYTFGAMIANELMGWVAIAVALMSIFLVVRHTRTEEETGRAELMRASVLGRHATTVATLLVVCGAHLIIGVLLALGLPVAVPGLAAEGSWAFGLAVAATGIAFAGIAICVAQFSPYGRGATGLASGALGAAYVLRAAGDMGDGRLSWLSPLGWAQATRAYVDERWWPLLLPVGLFALLVAAAMALSVRRDVGRGLLPDRRGPARASEVLVRPLGLAFRLHRGVIVGWAVGLALFGLGYGTFISEAEEFASENEVVREFLGADGARTFSAAFAAMIALLLSLLATAFSIQAALRLRGEETAGRAEPLLATALPRWRWVGSHLAVALASGAGMLLLAGIGMGVTATATTDDGGWLPRMAGAVLVHVPALALCVGVAVALFGLAPRFTSLAWLVPAYALVVGVLGGLLNLPRWLNNLSPFDQTPQVPASDFEALPLVVMSAVAVALVAVGILGFSRRDLETT